ncbi:hypothetical protein C7212DRAFT_337265, partial [Tuber magnatum]
MFANAYRFQTHPHTPPKSTGMHIHKITDPTVCPQPMLLAPASILPYAPVHLGGATRWPSMRTSRGGSA